MPRNTVNYDNTHFYKLVCRDLDVKECYIGCTTDFTRRKARHKHNCSNEACADYNINVYRFIRDNGGWDNWDMILIETRRCENKLDASKIEREYIETYNASLNHVKPLRTTAEYKHDNADTIKEKQTKYREDNKETIKDRDKQYRENNRDHLNEKKREYRESHQEHIKQYSKDYYLKNRERVIENVRTWKENNKEKIRERKSCLVTCECGVTIRRDSLNRHVTSNRHIKHVS